MLDRQTTQQTNEEPTNRQIFDLLETTAGTLQNFVSKTDLRLEKIDNRLFNLESNVDEIKETMVTKTDLKEGMETLKGAVKGIVALEDRKVNKLVDVLHENRTLTNEDIASLRKLDIFPQSV